MSPKYAVHFIITILNIILHAFSIEQIDKEHLKLYPYCGRMFGYDSSNTKSRVVNSEDSLEYELYPWVVYVETKYKNKRKKFEYGMCGGTVIAYK